jgi:hypothetical protein
MILQHLLINKLRAKFGNEELEKRTYRTHGIPRFKVINPDQYSELNDPGLQSRYLSKIGMILYSNYSRSDICNVVRELGNCMDGATMGTYLAILRVIKIVLDKEKFGLKF